MRRVDSVVLAQRMAFPVVAQEDAAMIGMPVERDAEHVVALALHPVGPAPYPGQGGTAVSGDTGAHEHAQPRVQVVGAADNLPPLLLPVDGRQEVEEAAAERLACEACDGLPAVDRKCHGETLALDTRLETELLTDPGSGVGGGERGHFAPVFWNSATFSCSFKSPYIRESGVGGHPGTYTSTGTTRSTPFTT